MPNPSWSEERPTLMLWRAGPATTGSDMPGITSCPISKLPKFNLRSSRKIVLEESSIYFSTSGDGNICFASLWSRSPPLHIQMHYHNREFWYQIMNKKNKTLYILCYKHSLHDIHLSSHRTQWREGLSCRTKPQLSGTQNWSHSLKAASSGKSHFLWLTI